MDNIKWSQWSPQYGMIRCGRASLHEIMKWMKDLGADAKKCLCEQEKPHAVYGRKIYNSNDEVEEVRFYCDTYMDDDELIEAVKNATRDVFYVAHK